MRTVAAATAVNMLAILPVFLFGGLAVLVRADLGFSAAALGAAVSAFFGVSALVSVPGGRFAERVGAYGAMVGGTLASGVSLLGIAAFARTYAQLVAWLCLGAVANAVVQPAVNLSLAQGVDPSRRGLAFGIKEASIPVATLAAGSAVPVVGLTVGWRWAFAGAAALAVVAAALAVRPPPGRGSVQRVRATIDTPVPALASVTVGGAFGAMGAIAMGTFYVESAVAFGVSTAAAGWCFAGASAAGLAGRILWGWHADRRAIDFPFVALLLAAGAVGVAALAVPRLPVVFGLGSLVAFAAGWGWMGVYSYAVVLANLRAPAAATGVTTAGIFAGGVLGPLLFGLLVERTSYTVAWLAAATAMLAAAALLLAAKALSCR